MCEDKVYDVSIFVNKIWLCKGLFVYLHPTLRSTQYGQKTDLETQNPFRIFRQMKNKVMKAVLSVLEGLAMGILVATIVTAVGFVTMYPLAYLMGVV